MNKTRFGCFLAVAAMVLAAGGLHAQTSIQRISLYLLGNYQKDYYYTNLDNPDAPVTNVNSRIRTILIDTHNVVKALAVDLDGTNTGTNANWRQSELVREVNLADGAEGIFLRKNGNQTNVSSFFGMSFSNNFQAGLPFAFPLVSNDFTNITFNETNVETNFVTNNFVMQNPLDRGWVYMAGATNSSNNFIQSAGLYFLSLNTTNLKFNVVCEGPGTVSIVSGRIDGTNYSRPINSHYVGCAGNFYLNTATNIFDMGTNPPFWTSGPLRGSFATGVPYFSPTNGP